MKKRFIIVLVAVVLLAVVVWAGEKEDLTLKYEALVARFNRAYQKLPELKALNEAQRKMPEWKALQDFGRELEGKNLAIKDGVVVEKPKPGKKDEPKK